MNVRIVGRFHGVEVIGDPSVADLVVNGPHRLVHDGDTVVVEGTAEGAGGSASASGAGVNVVVQVGGSGPPVNVRVPASVPVAVDIDIDAANVDLRDLAGAVRARVKAGNVLLQRCRGEAVVEVEAGSVSVLLPADAGIRLRAVADVGTVTGTDEGGVLVVGDGAAAVDVHVNVGSVRAGVG